MFLKKLTYLAVSAAVVCRIEASAPAPKPKEYLENLKNLQTLIEKKKSAKHILPLDVLFEEYVVDTKELLKTLDEQNPSEQKTAKKEETLKQIAYYMAVLQKLLTIMNSNQPEPLETFCRIERTDSLWGSLCGDRPAKRVWRTFEKEKQPQSSALVKARHNDEKDDVLPLGAR